MASYVSDGYTRDGYIAPAVPENSGERIYDELRFTYRPATRREVTEIDAKVSVAARNREFDPRAAINAEKIACDFVASRIITWSLKDVGVHEVAVTGDAVARLQVYLFTKLYGIIRGEMVNDIDPEATIEQKTDAEQLKN